MAWIESHQTLHRHRKVKDLSRRMEWDRAKTIGHLHMFWWWCVDHCEDGDLSKRDNADIAEESGVPDTQADAFVDAMIKSGWIDVSPYRRVHNWWDYAGKYLSGYKYKHSPAKWKKIKAKYVTEHPAEEITAPEPSQTCETQNPQNGRNYVQTDSPTNGGTPYRTEPNRTEQEFNMADGDFSLVNESGVETELLNEWNNVHKLMPRAIASAQLRRSIGKRSTGSRWRLEDFRTALRFLATVRNDKNCAPQWQTYGIQQFIEFHADKFTTLESAQHATGCKTQTTKSEIAPWNAKILAEMQARRNSTTTN